MVKVTRTYYSRRRGAYRNFYRRYTRRINRKMYNQVRLNYMKAKIGFAFQLAVNTADSNNYWFKEITGAQRQGKIIDVLDKLNDLDEYKLYYALFNEVKLLGVSVKFTPQNTGLSRNINPVTVYCTYKKENYKVEPVALTTCSIVRKYYKNWDRKWVPADQQQAVINQGRDLDFFIDTAAQSSANDANSCTWYCEVIAYMQFRKNLTL